MGARSLLFRRTGALGIALTAYDIWRRIPPHHRKTILAGARKHGPRVVKAAASQATGSRRKR